MEFILVNLWMDYDLDMVLLNGIMGKYFKAIGVREQKMDLELGNRLKEIIIKVNGY